MLKIRPYRDEDRERILALWQRALPLDGITASEFERRVLLDWNREEESLTVAESGDNTLAGFILALAIRYPIENTGTLEHRGFITAFGVDPTARGRGVGEALLNRAEDYLQSKDRREVAIAPYTPSYFVPGVDKERHAEGLRFLNKRGYREYSEGIAMDAAIGRFEVAPDLVEREEILRGDGIYIQPFHRGRMKAYLEFMARHMPGPWLEDARRNLRDMTRGLFPENAIILALHQDEIIGYCQFEGEHFGPFGIIEGWQGKGVGTLLLARTLYQMRLHGHHAAFVLWTGERAAQGVYKRLGFSISRRFAILRKELAR